MEKDECEKRWKQKIRWKILNGVYSGVNKDARWLM